MGRILRARSSSRFQQTETISQDTEYVGDRPAASHRTEIQEQARGSQEFPRP